MPDLNVLLALVLGLLYLEPGPYDVPTGLAGTLAAVAVGVAMSWMAGDRGERAVKASRLDVAVRSAWMSRLWPLVAWVAALSFFHWGSLVEAAVPREAWLGRYAVLFLPAAFLWAASWMAEARIESAVATAQGALVRRPRGLAAAWSGVRRNALALFPLVALLGLLDGLWILGEWGVPGVRPVSRWIEALPLLSIGVMLTLLALFSLFLATFLRLVLPTESLAKGRLRTLLEEQAAAIGLRTKDIVVWKTRGNVTNAMVVGFTPGTRTIFLTDGLLRHLPDDEILAVFCHEAGHAVKGHLPLLIALFGITALLFQAGGDVLVGYGVPPGLILLGQLLVLWFVILGVISRFLEREADLYGAEHAADLAPGEPGLYVPVLAATLPAGTTRMIRALQRVRQVSGRGSSHRHGTIEQRVEYLAGYAVDPDVRRRFARKRRQLLVGSALLGIVALLGAGLRLPADLATARASMAYEDGIAAYERAFERAGADGRAQAAAPHWQAAYDAFGRAAAQLAGAKEPRAVALRIGVLYGLGDTALHGLDDLEKARRDYEAALAALDAAPAAGLPDDERNLRFQIHVDLGRVLARQGALEEARAQLDAARAWRPGAEGPEGAYGRARIALLQAALDAAAGEVEAARARLEGHVLRAAGGGEDDDRWVELRRDARAALARLPAPAADDRDA